MGINQFDNSNMHKDYKESLVSITHVFDQYIFSVKIKYF